MGNYKIKGNNRQLFVDSIITDVIRNTKPLDAIELSKNADITRPIIIEFTEDGEVFTKLVLLLKQEDESSLYLMEYEGDSQVNVLDSYYFGDEQINLFKIDKALKYCKITYYVNNTPLYVDAL